MNKRILRLAIPNIISNITIPLLGMVNTAMAGHLGDEAMIGAVAVGAAIFNFIYWNCGFIRMGTSGLTAQALGARNLQECTNLLIRSVCVALGIALLLLVLQVPVGRAAMLAMKSGDDLKAMIAEYFFTRVWAAPATISLYSIHGWFIGMQNSRTPMWVSIIMNVINICVSLWLVWGLGMGVKGIALGTVIAQYSGAAMSWVLWFIFYGRLRKYIDWKLAMRLKPMLRFFNVNKDIFLRSFCNVCVYTFFTWASTGLGDTLLATNTILIQLFTFFSYISDGFGYAAEAITGKFTGARNFGALRHAVRNMFWWAAGIAVLFVGVYRLFWRQIIGLFTDSQSILACAGDYIIWIMLVPLVAFAPFLMDGILIGATRTKILRNSMFIATLVFFGLYYSLVGSLGNTALWLAFVVFVVVRGITQFFMSDKLRILYKPQ